MIRSSDSVVFRVMATSSAVQPTISAILLATSFLFFCRTVRAIPIAAAKEDPEALERAYDAVAQALAAGELVGLFPEGRLTSDGEMGLFRSGIARILERTPVPVIPMALCGLWQSLFARNRDKFSHLAQLFPKTNK